MVTIEENGIVATAETYAKAKRHLAKLTAEAEARERQRIIDGRIAELKAESNAYRVLCRKARNEAFPRGWHYSDDDSPVACFKVLNPGEDIITCQFQSYEGGELHNGTLNIYASDHLHAIVSYGSGILGAFIVWGGQPMEFYAIGVHNGQLRWVTVPGIVTSDFSN